MATEDCKFEEGNAGTSAKDSEGGNFHWKGAMSLLKVKDIPPD